MEESVNQQIENVIKWANQFYNGLELDVDDKTYDEELEKVRSLFPKFNIFDHLTIDESQQKRRHLSKYVQPKFKNKIEEYNELIHTVELEDGNYLASPKFDGSSITAYYNRGKLTQILSRSDEVIGVDQTEKLRHKVPAEVNSNIVKIDFEALTSIEDFPQNSRQKSNGLINSKYLQEEVDNYLFLFPFYIEVVDGNTRNEDYIEYNILAGKLNLPGFSFDPPKIIKSRIDKDNTAYVASVHQFGKCISKHFPIDGIVMYNPKNYSDFHIYKFYYIEAKDTTVTDIEWNINGNNTFIPKVIIKPVKIDGSRITKVASGGYRAMINSGIGIGSIVRVVRSGSTIPKIIKVLKTSDNYKLDFKCPYCGSGLKVIGGSHRCSNPECKYIIDLFYSEINESLNDKDLSGDELIKEISKSLIKSSRLLRLRDSSKLEEDFINTIKSKEKFKSKTSYNGVTELNNEILVHYSPVYDKLVEEYYEKC